jgi:molybdenum cofactor synthesis domain-containing protein
MAALSPEDIPKQGKICAMANPTPVTAAVLIIGDEILSGRTQDTNLNSIAKFLGTHGVDLAEARVVGDVEAEIVAAVNSLRERYDYLFTTGGIGPTHDDITADCVAKAFEVPLYEHPEIIQMMQSRWAGELNAARRRMARVPEGGSLVKNPVQGPPGFQIGNVFVLAGVPTIMRGMLEDIGHRLRSGVVVISRTLRVEGFGEGVMALPLETTAKAYPDLSMGSYPFFSPAGYGSQLVIRGRDRAMIEAAQVDLIAALEAAGVNAITVLDSEGA